MIPIDLPEELMEQARALGLLEKDSIARIVTEAVHRCLAEKDALPGNPIGNPPRAEEQPNTEGELPISLVRKMQIRSLPITERKKILEQEASRLAIAYEHPSEWESLDAEDFHE